MEYNPNYKITLPSSEGSEETAASLPWLPYCCKTEQFKYSVLIGEKLTNSAWPGILNRWYNSFSSVCHLTSLEEAKNVVENDGIIPTETPIPCWRENESCKQSCCDTVRFVPNTTEQVSLSSQGDAATRRKVKFLIDITGDGGIIDHQFGAQAQDPNDSDSDIYYWNHYFVGIHDRDDVSVCRILVTRNVFPHLLSYEPTEFGGPWYWHVTENKHYHVQSILGYDNKRRRVVVEFLRESEKVQLSKPGKDWSVIIDVAFIQDESASSVHRDQKDSSPWQNQCRIISCKSNKQITTELLFLSWFHSRKINITDIPGLKLARLRELIQEFVSQNNGNVRHQILSEQNTNTEKSFQANDLGKSEPGRLEDYFSLFAKDEPVLKQ